MRGWVLVAALLAGGPAGATLRLDDKVAAAATGAVGELRAALDALRGASPTRADLDRAEKAMAALSGAVDTYFHAGNLRAPAARPAAAVLRGLVQRLLSGPTPLLVLRDDVIDFQPAIHRDIAAACARLGDHRDEVRHLRAAVAVEGPTLDDLATLRAAYLALGDTAAADAVAAEIAQLRTASRR
jgi:hypothetical protein